MTDILQTLNSFFSATRHRGAGAERPIAQPVRDWRLLCLGGALLLLCFMGFGFWMYLAAGDIAQSFGIEQPIAPDSVGPSSAELQNILGNYSARQSEYADLLKAPLSLPDPAR